MHAHLSQRFVFAPFFGNNLEQGFFLVFAMYMRSSYPPKQAEMCTRLTTELISIVMRSMSDDLKLKKLVRISAQN